MNNSNTRPKGMQTHGDAGRLWAELGLPDLSPEHWGVFHQRFLPALAQAPAVQDAKRMQWLAVHFPEVRLWFLEGQSRWGINNVPGAWNTLREAVDAALGSDVPVQPTGGE